MDTENKDSGGPFHADEHNWGISRRDWLAGLAMQGIIANHTMNSSAQILVAEAYGIADLMIEEGKK